MPKALVQLDGEALVVHAVRRLLAAGGVNHVVVVVPATHETEFAEVLGALGPANAVVVVPGGAERSDSVRAGLRALDRTCDLVLVHDAARALAPPALIRRVVAVLDAGADAVVPAVPVVDTVKVVEPLARDGLARVLPHAERVVATPVRSALRAVQTPQGFRRSTLVAAHESGLDATDDAALVELAGGEVVVVPGDQLALKVTTPLDLVVAEHLLRELSAARSI